MDVRIDRLRNDGFDILERRLRAVGEISGSELDALTKLPHEFVDIPPRTDFVLEGMPSKRCYLIVEGVAVRFNFTRGGGRQIHAVHIAGDIPDLQSLHLRRTDHGIGSVSACRLAMIEHEPLFGLLQHSPTLYSKFWRETQIDAALYRAMIIRIARLGALERLAHLICELRLRFGAVGLVSHGGFDFPMTQEMVGQVLGLSIVSVNRALQTLRFERLIRWERSRVEIMDWDRLASLAEFESDYLHLVPCRDGTSDFSDSKNRT